MEHAVSAESDCNAVRFFARVELGYRASFGVRRTADDEDDDFGRFFRAFWRETVPSWRVFCRWELPVGALSD